ncbi:TIGR02117 family protein [Mesorhizobium sp. CGMCC 1.15528]|uniref:TIGR02117 family protein n=1 Tax=Mesorhizobium zhangyense TaxID=1776730 RepID=A0A7C9VBP4_9HYPH|nr:TIGR02117 family protein [Mesorhizobium zhangyense]NGN43326.1 TIGR02117 family protein [Mesorhizobium zhangyense]
MKRIIRFAGVLLLAVFITVVLGTLIPRPLLQSGETGQGPLRRILVLTNPIHTDIAIPIDAEMLERFDFLRTAGLPVDLSEVRYLVFGWGSRAFYIETPTWSQLKAVPVLKALSLDNSTMHVEVAGAIPEPNPVVAGYDLGEDGFQRLLTFIEESFRQGANGPELIEGAAYGDYDAFFEANGYFNALVGCNTWTAGALRAAGLQTGWWNPLPVTLGYSLRLHN